jgi:hypothetical protein
MLGERAAVSLLYIWISDENRRWRWPGNLGADGKVPFRMRNLDRRREI